MYKLTSNRAVLILAYTVILTVAGCSKEDHKFAVLQSSGRDTEKSRQLSLELKDTHEGIRLALKDINCYGGTTEGWSSWILRKSILSSQVNCGLAKICTNEVESMSRRIEASRLLWERTGELTWMVQWYGFVQKSGKPVIGIGRKYLVSTVDFGEFRGRVDVPASENTSLTVYEFTNLFMENIIHPFNLQTNQTTTKN